MVSVCLSVDRMRMKSHPVGGTQATAGRATMEEWISIFQCGSRQPEHRNKAWATKQEAPTIILRKIASTAEMERDQSGQKNGKTRTVQVVRLG